MDEKGHAKFPFYWNRIEKRVLSINFHNLSQFESVILDYLFENLSSKKKIVSSTKLLKWNTKRAEVLKYLSKFLSWFLYLSFSYYDCFLTFFSCIFSLQEKWPPSSPKILSRLLLLAVELKPLKAVLLWPYPNLRGTA